MRDLDAAWELRGDRRVYGFFVVEGATDGAVPPPWRNRCNETVDARTLLASLPHRTSDERARIADAFLGATTWQAICRTLDLEIPL